MPKLKVAIQRLKRDEIARFEEAGCLTVEGCELQTGDLKVLLPVTSNCVKSLAFLALQSINCLHSACRSISFLGIPD